MLMLLLLVSPLMLLRLLTLLPVELSLFKDLFSFLLELCLVLEPPEPSHSCSRIEISTVLFSRTSSSSAVSDLCERGAREVSSPFTEPLVEPFVDPFTDASTEPNTEPEPFTDPFTEPCTEPFTEFFGDT